MLKSKAIDILKSFSEDELKKFRDFVRSPYHNKNSNVIKLYELIRKHHPEYTSPAIEKEKLFHKLYPGKKYNDTVIRILLSDLLRLGEEFLIYNKSKKSPFGESLMLLEELKDRGLDSLYQTNYKTTLSLLKEIDDIRTKYFSSFELEIVNVDYFLRRDKQQMIADNVLERAENLLYFMLIEIVRNYHDLVINERTFNAKFEFNLVQEFINNFSFKPIVEKLKQYRPQHYPIILIYYNLMKALTDEQNEESYNALKSSVETYMANISTLEAYHLLHDLETCCLNRMKYNTPKYRKEIFEVYKIMLASKVYSFGSEEMTAQRFKNILVAAINLNELEWAEKFVSQYSPRVQPEYRESMHFYSLALLSFSRKDYGNSLQNINRVKNDYFILKMDIKSWTLKIYYELGYLDQVFSYIDSYRHFLSKNKALSEHFKERHHNFLKFTAELLRLRSGADKSSKHAVEKELTGANNVVNKEWLAEKLKEL